MDYIDLDLIVLNHFLSIIFREKNEKNNMSINFMIKFTKTKTRET